MAEPVLIYDERIDAWECRIPFNPDALNELKTRIPGGARVWKPESKTWVYDNMFIDTVRDVCKKYYGGFREHKPQPPPAPIIQVEGGFYKDFLEAVGREIANKLYRMAAAEAHPDKNNGSGDRMTKLNVAWGKVKSDLGW